jgi:hypothetical protein
VITYNYTVTNTGDISILGGTLILNDMVGATPVTLSPVCSSFSNNLAPGQTWQCTGTYTTTAADVTAGEVTDAATAQTNDVVYASTQNGQDAITIPKT